MSLGKAIKKQRLKKGLSQKGLGELCDPVIDASNIRRYENDTVSPTTDTLIRISKALNVPVTDFFSDENAKEALLQEAKNDPDKFQYEMLVKDLFYYVCSKGGYITVDEVLAGWSDCFRVVGDNVEFRIQHEDVRAAFNKIVQHISMELPTFLEEHKLDNGK